MLPYIAKKECADVIKDPEMEDYPGSSGWAIYAGCSPADTLI